MTRHQLHSLLAFSLSLFLGSTCVTKPIAQQYREEAKAEDLTFSAVLQNPDAYVGGIVLWGGDIIETTNTQEGTSIVVLETPLSGHERPEGAKRSQGRFIAMSSKFLDPALYKKGRKITMAGVVAGKKALPLGNTTYTYPVVTVKQLHLWERRPPTLITLTTIGGGDHIGVGAGVLRSDISATSTRISGMKRRRQTGAETGSERSGLSSSSHIRSSWFMTPKIVHSIWG